MTCTGLPVALTAPGFHKPKASAGRKISRLTQGFSIRCLRFTSDVAASHARLASGWRAAPHREGVEPSGPLRKVSGHISLLPSRTCPVASGIVTKKTASPILVEHKDCEKAGPVVINV